MQIGLVEIKQQNFHRIAAVNIEKNYREVFDGQLGKLPGVTTLQLKPDAVPTVMSNRRIPVVVRLLLKEELNRLTRLGVIEPFKNPTPWVSQLVLTRKKNGALRICLDPHELNKALMREHYIMPILEDVLHDMRSAKIFTTADLSSGYWHVELDHIPNMFWSIPLPSTTFWCKLCSRNIPKEAGGAIPGHERHHHC